MTMDRSSRRRSSPDRGFPSPASLALLLLLLAAPGVSAQTAPRTGPVIQGFGPTFDIPDPDYPTPLAVPYRVIFDIADAAGTPDGRSTRFETVARFLNMHVKAGVPREKLEVVVAVHGAAGKDLLDHAGYRERHGIENPNAELIRALLDAGVEIALCGQTAASRGLGREELLPGVKLALSAMTTLVTRQNQGYALIPW
jgi:intracellular sulfur oxidation DsrE/DsrF family protein